MAIKGCARSGKTEKESSKKKLGVNKS